MTRTETILKKPDTILLQTYPGAAGLERAAERPHLSEEI